MTPNHTASPTHAPLQRVAEPHTGVGASGQRDASQGPLDAREGHTARTEVESWSDDELTVIAGLRNDVRRFWLGVDL